MIKTIKEMLQDWWADSTTTRMPLPTLYTYEVLVDGKVVQIESFSPCRLYVHYKARKKYPNARSIRVVKQTRPYSFC